MAEFNYDNLAKNLPDCYKKDITSNNYKILEIERYATADLRKCLYEIESILDIDNASGAVLDAYGERFGQPRGRATDEQYRIMIKSKIARNLSGCSYKGIVDAICVSFGCSPDDVHIAESDTSPMAVSVEKAPLTAIINAGFTTMQAYQIIKSLLPAAIELEAVSFEGTFEFSDNENDYDETAGFADKDGEPFDEDIIGGYFGAAESELNDAVLPI